MTPQANVVLEEQRRVVVARLSGEIDVTNRDEVYATLDRAVTNTALGLVVDLSEIGYFDSAAVHLLFDVRTQLQRHRQGLRIVVPPDTFIRRVLQIVNLDAEVGLDETVAEALSKLHR